MKCCDCPYWYQERGDFPECNWISRCPGDCAPCEEEDYVEEENYMEDDEDE